MLRFLFLKLFLISQIFSSAFGQIENYAEDFILPLKISPVLTGGFGEPRTRHFHSGIDFRTYRNGRPVYAVADGYISRVTISPWGYGYALYLNHPNGFTSVYAHLQKFKPEVEKWIKQVQYQKRSFRVDTTVLDNKFPVKQGDLIGYSGNTGHSFGPHLHFEIRDTETQKTFNLLNTVYDIKDDISPEVYGVVLNPINYNSKVDGVNEKSYLPVKRISNGKYVISNKIPIVSGNIGFSVDYVDRMTGTRNRYGARCAKLYINEKLYYHSSLNELSFSNQSQKNSMFDYDFYLNKRKHVHKLYKEPNNTKNIFKTLINDGTFVPEDNKVYDIEIRVIDYYDNTSVIKLQVKGNRVDSSIEKPDNILNWNEDNLIIDEGLRLEIDSGTLFFNQIIPVEKLSDSRFSPKFKVGNQGTGLKQNYTLYLSLSNDALNYRDNLFIACTHNNRMMYYDANFIQSWVYCNPNVFGDFEVRVDTVPPVVKPINIRNNANMSKKRFIEFEISDDLSGISSYDLFIDEKWVLLKYEPKDRSIRYYFDQSISKDSKKELRLVVTDRIGNETVYECEFYF